MFKDRVSNHGGVVRRSIVDDNPFGGPDSLFGNRIDRILDDIRFVAAWRYQQVSLLPSYPKSYQSGGCLR